MSKYDEAIDLLIQAQKIVGVNSEFGMAIATIIDNITEMMESDA